MTETWRSVAGTGHRPATRRNPDGIRPEQLPWIRERCRAGLVFLRERYGTELVRSGFALDWDLILASTAVELGFALHADIPFEAQPDSWPAEDRAEWRRLRALAASETVYGPEPQTFAEVMELLELRNDGLLRADTLFALLSRRKGGTWRTVEKAQRLGRPGIHLDPVERRTRLVQSGGWLNEGTLF